MPVTRKIDAHHDFSGVGAIVRALLNPVATDPVSPNPGEVWFNTTDNRLKIRGVSATIVLASLDDVTSGSITGGLWDAQSVVAAVTDNNPAPVVLGPGTILGRRTAGDIGAVTYGQLLSDLQNGGLNDLVDTRAQALVNAMVGAAPDTLNTLVEIAEALNNDPGVIDTILSGLAARTRKFSDNVGDGAATLFTLNHNLGTTAINVTFKLNSTGEYFDAFFDAVDANNVQVGFNTVYPTDAVEVTVIG